MHAPGDFWAWCKQIDELGGEWTFSLFVPRAMNFHFSYLPVDYYEPLGEFRDVLREARLADLAQNSGLSVNDIGGLVVDFDAFPSLFNPVDGTIPMPESDEQSIGRHAARIMSALDDETLLLIHAWEGWTPDQQVKMKRAYFEKYSRGVLLTRRWDRGPLPNTLANLLEDQDPKAFRNLWCTPRCSLTMPKFKIGNRKFVLKAFPTMSTHRQSLAEVLTLELRNKARIGVAIVIHERGRSILTELFIWPAYRGLNLGIVLEKFAVERVKAIGNKCVDAIVSEADLMNGRERAGNFLRSRGYEIKSSSSKKFSLVASKDLV